MKKAKKLFAMLLALVLVLGLAAPAMAAGDGDSGTESTYTITIKNDKAGHTYGAYQIFKGDLASADGTGNTASILSNIEWGSGVNGEALLSVLKSDSVLGNRFANAASAADVAKALTEPQISGDDLDAFAALVGVHLTDTKKTVTVTADAEPPVMYQITELSAGYYFVKDEDEVGGYDAATKFILELVENTEVTPKSDIPTADKKVDDKNDSNNLEDGEKWEDSADYDIGDAVPFQLTGTVARNYDDYEVYKFIFHDKQSDGLTFDDESVEVFVDGVKIESGFSVVTGKHDGAADDDDCTFHIVFDNLKDIGSVKAGSKITVTYSSTLNDKAVIGGDGNPNTMHLEFSNNPNDTQGGETGNTPEETVVVFTYQVVVNKTDEVNQPLTGAEFTLEKRIGEKPAEGEATWEVIGVVKNDEGTTFTFSGLDDGIYRLTETKTPSGYNTIEAFEFEIQATHTKDGISELKVIGAPTDVTFTPTIPDGTLTTTIVNKSGATLPETGGIGTTIFYILGGVLVVGAGIVFVTKRRMDVSDR